MCQPWGFLNCDKLGQSSWPKYPLVTQPQSSALSPCDWNHLVEGDWQGPGLTAFSYSLLDETKLKDKRHFINQNHFPQIKVLIFPRSLGRSQHQLPAAVAVMQLLKALLMPHRDPAFASHSGHLLCLLSCPRGPWAWGDHAPISGLILCLQPTAERWQTCTAASRPSQIT